MVIKKGIFRYNDMNFGLIGRKLEHSLSQQYFELRHLNSPHTYNLFELENLSELGLLIESQELFGFNVTIPYKQEIIPMLDALTPEAKTIGAVNTVIVNGKQLIGHNTDAPAFLNTLKPHLTMHQKRALILGNGGASKAVVWALQQMNISYTIASHNEIDHQDDRTWQEFDILINATPVGMYPNCETTPWKHLEMISSKTIVYDLVYNPSPTLLLKQAQEQGATTIDGLAMLHQQAELAWQFWGIFEKMRQ